MGVALKNGINDLETWCLNNGELGQRILDEWDWEKNLENHLPVAPCDVQPYSGLKTWWKCKECGKSYKMRIASRTKDEQGCFECGHKRGGIKNHQNALENGNDLFTWCQNNGARGIRLLEEWDSERNLKELNITITDVTYGCGTKVYWECMKCKNCYMCSVSHRTINGTNCSLCSGFGTSYPEQFLYNAIKQICPYTMNREKFYEGLEYDIYVPEWNLYIEYGSSYYHKGKEEKDAYKKETCVRNGGRFLSIMDDEDAEREVYEADKIIVNVNKDEQDVYIRILDYILEQEGHSISEIDIDSACANSIKRMGRQVEEGKDVKTLFPKLVKEWLTELNNGAMPENYSCGSHFRVKWKCTKCGITWENSIHSRIAHKSGCPKCGYCIFDERTHGANQERTKYKVFSVSKYI